MAKYREIPCKYYEALGLCKKGRQACHKHCSKYQPRAKVRCLNKKSCIWKNAPVKPVTGAMCDTAGKSYPQCTPHLPKNPSHPTYPPSGGQDLSG